MEFLSIVDAVLTVIGSLIALLTLISPFTKAKWDDKVLNFLKMVWSMLKVRPDDNEVVIKISKK